MTGAMKDRVSFLRPRRVPDGGGGFEVSFTPDREFYAHVERRGSGRERLETSIRRQRIRLLLRSEGDFLYEMRIRHLGRDYRILKISDRDEGAGVLIDAEEVRG